MIYIWGAGLLGKKAIEYFGKENVIAIIDNDICKQGDSIQGIKIISFEQFLHSKGEEIVICASWKNTISIQEQLKNNNINNYSVFNMQLFEDVDLIYNQYDYFEGISEEKWNESKNIKENKIIVSDYVKENSDVALWPHEIEIETINKCNGICSFCPVNIRDDIRRKEIMSETLFMKIVDELHDLDYSGRIALFSNNEPLLDKRIIKFSEILRKEVPKAQIHMFTNGTLLSIDIFSELIKYLDELIIDNYDQELLLIPQVKKIKEYVEDLNDLQIRKKVKILLRKPNEFLSSRGGDAPNRHKIIDVSNEVCALPFCQMVVRPSGKISLCCNDPYGKYSLGDLNKESILEVWNGEKFSSVRKKIKCGRKNEKHCEKCDTFMVI